MPSIGLSCNTPWPSGNTICCIWPWIRRCCGIPTVWCVSRSCIVVLTSDRGFADTHLMEHLTALGWHWRIRIKGSFWVYRRGKRPCKVNRIPLSSGKALFWQHVYVTKQEYGPVHLALGRPVGRKEYWFV